jgi:peptidoglycan hydrolase CwlO-like protein
MQLEAKIEDSNRNKQVNDKKLAEALLIAGKVPQLDEQINEFKRKIEKYNTTIDNLREQLEIVLNI